tara:strand:+ start:539 stop:715 length:177 start_codon:yes stop_codon:yes gene_type:complete
LDEDSLEKKEIKQKLDLEPMSIEELLNYIAEMKEEISRVESEIDKKKDHRAGVESIFK